MTTLWLWRRLAFDIVYWFGYIVLYVEMYAMNVSRAPPFGQGFYSLGRRETANGDLCAVLYLQTEVLFPDLAKRNQHMHMHLWCTVTKF